jgi:hypothetical protein
MEKKNSKKSSAAENNLGIESYGVKIGIKMHAGLDIFEVKKRISQIFPSGFREIKNNSYDHTFLITREDSVYEIFKNQESITKALNEEMLWDHFESQLRITVAEFAVGKVFLHAGVVGWKGQAIIIPAKSFQGKTTLVAELVKRGAEYYSDEYAVLDENGAVHPFPKMLSMRGIIDDYTQLDIPVEEFGGTAAVKPIPVGMVLITEYKKSAKWKPKKLTAGQGMMEILSHTIPIRNNPEFSLNVLNKIVNRAIITKTRRGEAVETAELLLGFFENQLKS